MNKQLSDEQLDAICGGTRDCGDGRGRDRDRDRDRDNDCGGRKHRGEHHRKHRRDNDDCRREYRGDRCD